MTDNPNTGNSNNISSPCYLVSNSSIYPNMKSSLPYVTGYCQAPKILNENLENDLKLILDDSNGVQIFNEFLEVEECAAHYLSFWFCCKGFKTAEENKIYDLIKGIYRKYIRSESKTAVALQPSTKKNIVDKIATKVNLDRSIFDEAHNEVWFVLVQDLFARFIKSDYFKRYYNSDKATSHPVDNLDSICFSDNFNDSEVPYVEYVTSSNSAAAAAALIMAQTKPTKDIASLSNPASSYPTTINTTTDNNNTKPRHSTSDINFNQLLLSTTSSTTTNNNSKHNKVSSASSQSQTNNNNSNNNNNIVGVNNTSTTQGNLLNNNNSKDRRGIAETDPTGFYKQLTAKLEKLRIMQQCGRSLLNTHKLIDPVDDDPQLILDIHDSFVMKKEPQKLEQSLSSTSIKRDADLRSVVSQDSGVATTCATNTESYWSYAGARGQSGPLQTQQKAGYYPSCTSPVAGAISSSTSSSAILPPPIAINSPPLSSSSASNNQRQQQHQHQHHHIIYHNQPYNPTAQHQNHQQQQPSQQQPSNNRQFRHHYRHDHHHFRTRRRNRSQDQSVCSLEENASHQMSYMPRKNKSQASDASSIFDSGVSSTYEQISHSLLVTTDRVSHWIINQPSSGCNNNSNSAYLGPGVSITSNTTPSAEPIPYNLSATTTSMKRSLSAQTPATTGYNMTLQNVTPMTQNNEEVWIDACCQDTQTHQMSLSSQPSSSTLIVGYYLCGDPVPYRTQVNRSSLNADFTLANFKQLLPRRGPYRYFFKRPCDEFEGGGAVHEEYTRDDDVLPLWEGKIVAKVEKIE